MELHGSPQGYLYGKMAGNEQLEISINGERAALLDIDPLISEGDPTGLVIQTDPIFVKAGAQRVSATFLTRAEGPVDDVMAPIEHTLAGSHIGIAYGITTLPHLRDFFVSGPHNVTGVSDTASRRKIFTCRPTSADGTPMANVMLTLMQQAGLELESFGNSTGAFDLSGSSVATPATVG